MTYRGSALPGAEGGLIGTAEHGVLGRRWIYDGTHDPVLVAQLVALIDGAAEPQAQSVSNTPDPTVTVRPVTGGCLAATESEVAGNGPSGTDLRVESADADGNRRGRLIVRVSRVLQPEGARPGRRSRAAERLRQLAVARRHARPRHPRHRHVHASACPLSGAVARRPVPGATALRRHWVYLTALFDG